MFIQLLQYYKINFIIFTININCIDNCRWYFTFPKAYNLDIFYRSTEKNKKLIGKIGVRWRWHFYYGIRKSLHHPFNHVCVYAIYIHLSDCLFATFIVFIFRTAAKLNWMALPFRYTLYFYMDSICTSTHVIQTYISALLLFKSDALQHDSVHTEWIDLNR